MFILIKSKLQQNQSYMKLRSRFSLNVKFKIKEYKAKKKCY